MTHRAAGAVDLAVILGVEVVDFNTTTAVVLDNLVGGVESTTATNNGHSASGILLDGNCILADVLEPGVLDGAATAETVDALALVGADNDVPDGGAGRQDEDRVALTCVDQLRLLRGVVDVMDYLPPSDCP